MSSGQRKVLKVFTQLRNALELLFYQAVSADFDNTFWYTLCQILSVLRLDNVPKLSTLRKNILSGFGVKSHLITPIESLNS